MGAPGAARGLERSRLPQGQILFFVAAIFGVLGRVDTPLGAGGGARRQVGSFQMTGWNRYQLNETGAPLGFLDVMDAIERGGWKPSTAVQVTSTSLFWSISHLLRRCWLCATALAPCEMLCLVPTPVRWLLVFRCYDQCTSSRLRLPPQRAFALELGEDGPEARL